jgi:hypothetical protein
MEVLDVSRIRMMAGNCWWLGEIVTVSGSPIQRVLHLATLSRTSLIIPSCHSQLRWPEDHEKPPKAPRSV